MLDTEKRTFAKLNEVTIYKEGQENQSIDRKEKKASEKLYLIRLLKFTQTGPFPVTSITIN